MDPSDVSIERDRLAGKRKERLEKPFSKKKRAVRDR
jgi:hypothetical protein